MSSQIEYPQAGIASIDSLASALRIPSSELVALANNTSNLYRKSEQIEKDDGSKRITYDALPPLKIVLSNFRKRIIDKVLLPEYISAGKKVKAT